MEDLLATQIVDANTEIKSALVIAINKDNEVRFHHHNMDYSQCLQNMTLLKKWILKELEKM